MRLNLKATNIVLEGTVREYLEKRLASLEKLINFEDPSVMIDVELGRTTKHHQSGDIFFAEINIHRGKETFRAVSEKSDIRSAIDDMQSLIGRELSSRKGKLRSLTRRGGYIAKALLKGGYEGIQYLGGPARAGWKYMRKLVGRQ